MLLTLIFNFVLDLCQVRKSYKKLTSKKEDLGLKIKQIHNFFVFSHFLKIFDFICLHSLNFHHPLHPVYNDKYRSASYLQSFVLPNLPTNEFETITRRNQNPAQEIIKEKKEGWTHKLIPRSFNSPEGTRDIITTRLCWKNEDKSSPSKGTILAGSVCVCVCGFIHKQGDEKLTLHLSLYGTTENWKGPGPESTQLIRRIGGATASSMPASIVLILLDACFQWLN